MRSNAVALLGVVVVFSASRAPLPSAEANPNRTRGGTLSNGVLTVSLEARRTMWFPDGDSLPGRETTAFAEVGKSPSVPGPLLRVTAGTEIRLSLNNVDVGDTLRLTIPGAIHGAATQSAADTIVIPPSATRELRFTASTPGNYFYKAHGTNFLSLALQMHGLLGGAIVVDSAAPARPRPDRVFVINWSIDKLDSASAPDFNRSIFAINGKSWPRTERLSATAGDTLTYRIINLNADVHPMHLHGFYYRVDEFAPMPANQQPNVGRMAVTERMGAFSRMTMTWVPERAGNWLMHCHFALHLLNLPQVSKDFSAYFSTPKDDPSHAHENHAMTGMSGLVMAIGVTPRRGERYVEQAGTTRTNERKLRLVAFTDPGFPDSAPSMRFRIEERGRTITEAKAGFSPPLVLRRGEPVSITVVNTLREPTAVHWHGMELDSYYDGVAGYGGFGSRISPIVAPRDSFEARFTPPRAGTFIYHSHVKEVRQQTAGMVGAMIVLDSGRTMSVDDRAFFVKSSRATPDGTDLDVNGQTNPDTVVIRVGRPTRMRFIALTAASPNAIVWMTARPDSVFANGPDSLVVRWRPVAKDGADLPEASRAPRLARQQISMGETYDFEFTAPAKGMYRIEVRGSNPNTGRLLIRVPVRAE